MKTVSKLALSLTSALLLLANPAPADILLVSFENAAFTPSFYYAGNTWVRTPSATGFTISGSADTASEDGMGINITPVDISSMTDLSLGLRLNAGNTATRIQVILRNQNTSNTHTYQYDLGQFEVGQFKTVSLSLASPIATANGGVNFSNLDRIQIQGTSNNPVDSNFNITLQSVTAIPEPSSLFLMTGALLCMLALKRRKL